MTVDGSRQFHYMRVRSPGDLESQGEVEVSRPLVKILAIAPGSTIVQAI